MDRMPPRIVRRLVLAPLMLGLCLIFLAVSPALLLTAAVADLFLPGSWRTLRLVAFGVAYLALEVAGFAVLFGLWVAAGFGARIRSPAVQGWHYGFMAWWLHTLDRIARRLFRIRIHIEDRPVPRPGPILVFSRHAGPGNSLLLIGTILVAYRRHPRIVMLAKLQWEPLFDIMLNRTPNRFIKHDPARREIYINAISELAGGLGDMDAFVLFPEGKDFTPRVRLRAIDYLRRKGHDEAAERAERMRYVLPPRHNGVMAALSNARNADIVFVAHSVLEDIGTFKEAWSRIPLEQPIVARYWRISPDDVPEGEENIIKWLYDWWETIDGWIASRAGQATPAVEG